MDTLKEMAEQRLSSNAFSNYNHIVLESVEPDKAVFQLDIQPNSRNAYGLVHGGAIYTLADNAAGVAALTDGRFYVTQNSSFNFFRNQAQGIVRAVAHIRHRSDSTCLAEVEILGENNHLLAIGEFTFFCVDPGRMAQKSADHA